MHNNFHFKDQILDVVSSAVHKCGRWSESYYGVCIRYLNVRIGDHIGISPLTKKQGKPKNSSETNHLLFCKQLTSYDDFCILTCDREKCLLEVKDSLSMMRDKSSLSRKITSVSLCLFGRP